MRGSSNNRDFDENCRFRNAIWSPSILPLWVSARYSAWFGIKGSASNSIPDAANKVFPFLALQRLQDVTTFVQTSCPPRDRGWTWSRLRSLSLKPLPQYIHKFWSRRNRARLVKGGAFLPEIWTFPRQAIMLFNWTSVWKLDENSWRVLEKGDEVLHSLVLDKRRNAIYNWWFYG